MGRYWKIALFLFFASCQGLGGLLTPNGVDDVAVEKSVIREILKNPYRFDWPNFLICPRTEKGYICTTSNTHERLTISLSEWENFRYYEEMVSLNRRGLSQIISEIKTICKQDFNPPLKCRKNMDKIEFLNKLLTKGE